MQERNASEGLSLRIKIEKLVSGRFGSIVDLISLSFTVITFTLHLLQTYFNDIFEYLLKYDVIVMFFFAVEYLMQYSLLTRLYVSQHKIAYIFSVYPMICLFTITPLFFVFTDFSSDGLTVYKITLVTRSIRIVRFLVKMFSSGKNEVSRQIYTIFLTVFSLILVTAGIIQVFEQSIRDEIILKTM